MGLFNNHSIERYDHFIRMVKLKARKMAKRLRRHRAADQQSVILPHGLSFGHFLQA